MRLAGLHGGEVGCGHRVCRGTAGNLLETAILAGAPARQARVGGVAQGERRAVARDGRGGGRCCAAARLGRAKKTGANMAPEQQRQEENGDAPATPAAYRK
ncbi:protein of unknown function [Burkholderia multivorans]